MQERFLIIRPDHIGDMVMTTPFIHSVKKARPDARLAVLAGTWSLPVLKNNPYINELIVCNFPWLVRGGSSDWKNVAGTLLVVRKARYDRVFSLRIAAKTAAFVRLTGIKQRWGFDVKKSQWAYNRNVHYDIGQHVVDNFLAIAKASFGTAENSGTELFLEDELYDSIKSFVPEHHTYCVIAPGAGYATKLWEADRWAKVADSVSEELEIVITGSPAEHTYCETIGNMMKRKPVNLCGAADLRQLMAIIDKAALVISVDSAAMHIASAVKTPVVPLFGPTNPVQWGPYPNGVKNVIVSKRVECQFCKLSDCDHLSCMREIRVRDVLVAVKAAGRKTSGD